MLAQALKERRFWRAADVLLQGHLLWVEGVT